MADEHRTWRGARGRRYDDPATSDDPAIAGLIEQLGELARVHSEASLPRAEFRAELRAQLVAITPRIVAESAPATAPEASPAPALRAVSVLDRPRPSPRPRAEDVPDVAPVRKERAPRRSVGTILRGIPLARPLAVAASIVTVLALVLGGAVYMSRDAVPGDTLYGLKRASERFELSVADNDSERAQKYLEFATTRVQEARELVSRASASASGRGPLADGRLSAAASKQVLDALASADGDTQTASRLLGGVAVDSASPRPLTRLTSWAPDQLKRLSELWSSVPSTSTVATSTTKSVSLLKTASSRASTLAKTVDCNCLRNAPTDAFGPVPVVTPAKPRSSGTKSPAPRVPTTPSRTRGVGPSSGTGSGAGGTGNRSTTAPTTPRAPGASPTTKRPILQLPTLLPQPGRATTTGPNLDLCKVNLLGIKLCSSPSK